uniref:Uncharacterized protein n=1 Tax=Pseudictyota dubia TaxID=2749911 RepID=A0A7R9WC20_9STRA|mmetsp:Transcript_41697/g.77098  ORF Transcript_41697/g.77098 Transcript_41697/m.77098 type:complete len:209 (+) Transcript_41697:126-752(+)
MSPSSEKTTSIVPGTMSRQIHFRRSAADSDGKTLCLDVETREATPKGKWLVTRGKKSVQSKAGEVAAEGDIAKQSSALQRMASDHLSEAYAQNGGLFPLVRPKKGAEPELFQYDVEEPPFPRYQTIVHKSAKKAKQGGNSQELQGISPTLQKEGHLRPEHNMRGNPAMACRPFAERPEVEASQVEPRQAQANHPCHQSQQIHATSSET